MREIEFRGKWKSNGKWIYGSLVDKRSGERLISRYNEMLEFEGRYVHPETVGQYTGLLDKNGKKIFAGDIVKRSFGVGYSTARYPSFADGTERVSVGAVEYDCKLAGYRFLEQMDDINFVVTVEVIGNIHDNPELLESENGKEAAKCDCGERCERCDPALRHND